MGAADAALSAGAGGLSEPRNNEVARSNSDRGGAGHENLDQSVGAAAGGADAASGHENFVQSVMASKRADHF